MIIKSAKYKTSVVNSKNLLRDGVPEFAFVGRSNVGKSSLINSLTSSKSLAKTSATPGKTKMVNYFDINETFRFVDLPGYGFAKVGKSHLDVWSGLIGEYLLTSESLQTIFLLLDIRHLPTMQDKQMVDFLVFNGLPFMIIVTKADKIAKSKISNNIKSIAKMLNLRKEMFLVSSSENSLGKDKILNYIEMKLGS